MGADFGELAVCGHGESAGQVALEEQFGGKQPAGLGEQEHLGIFHQGHDVPGLLFQLPVGAAVGFLVEQQHGEGGDDSIELLDEAAEVKDTHCCTEKHVALFLVELAAQRGGGTGGPEGQEGQAFVFLFYQDAALDIHG